MALQAALPALRRRVRVTLLSLRHPRDKTTRSGCWYPDMIQFLLRHGVQARAESGDRDRHRGHAASRVSDWAPTCW
jgi:hypothetical protein